MSGVARAPDGEGVFMLRGFESRILRIITIAATVCALIGLAAPTQAAPKSPTITFSSTSTANGAVIQTGGAASYTVTVNRGPQQIATLTCTLTRPDATSTSENCPRVPPSSKNLTTGAKNYTNLTDPGRYTFAVSVRLTDGGTRTVSRTFTVNGAPVAGTDSTSTDEDTTLSLPHALLLANDADDGDQLVVTSVQGAVNGTVTFTPSLVVFTPAPNYFGSASFTYTISDGQGGTSTTTVNVTVNSVNDPPVAATDVVTANEDEPSCAEHSFFLENDVDSDGDPMTVTSAQNGVGGGAALVGPFVCFVSDLHYHGPATFTYTISDGQGGTSTATVNVTVNSVNDPPVAGPDRYGVESSEILTVPAPGVLSNDGDLPIEGGTVSVTVFGQPAFGSVVGSPDGSFVYDPPDDFSGEDSFDYIISDGQGGTALGTVTIFVVGPD